MRDWASKRSAHELNSSVSFHLIVQHGRCYFGLQVFELLDSETVNQLNGRYTAPAVHVVPYTVADLALAAPNLGEVGEISTKVALMCVFHDLVTVWHSDCYLVALG